MKDNIKRKLRLMSQFYFLQKMQNQNFMQKMQNLQKINKITNRKDEHIGRSITI